MLAFYAEREAIVRRRVERDRVEFDAAHDLVWELLGTRDRKLRQGYWLDRHPVHAEALAAIIFRAMKECGLSSGADPDFAAVGFQEREALRLAGYVVTEPVSEVLVSGGAVGHLRLVVAGD
jgi:hypothetical protein